MTFSPLMAISPLDGRYHGKINNLRPIFSEFGLIKFRVIVEIRWLQLLAKQPNLPELTPFSDDALQVLNSIIDNFSEKDAERVKQIETGINHDVKAVEYFIKEKIQDNKELSSVSEFIHFACTSEDINNLAYGLMLLSARNECILPALKELQDVLTSLSHQYAHQPMLARTHGQPATPTTIGKELANVVARIQRQTEQLNSSQIFGKINGASGNYNAHRITYPNIDWKTLSSQFVTELNLNWNPYTTQIEPHDYMAEMFHILIRINSILIDLNRDMWGYISNNYFQLKNIKNEVGSSTMPHKINPIDFENAEGNLGLSTALLDHMAIKLPISRWQRDLSDSTVLRNIGVAIGHALLAYSSTCKGLSKITPNVDVIAADLDNHWEILAEPIQTVMRRFGIEQPYERLKSFTRGKKMDKDILHNFISDLTLPDDIKKQLYNLTPSNYLGYAEDLAKTI